MLGISASNISHSAIAPSYRVAPDDSHLRDIATLEDCHSWTRQAVDAMVADERIDTVIISYRLAYYLYGSHEEAYPAIIDER